MDSGLKERLVGAAVLVALGVWLIPWVLDGRKPAPADAPPDGAQENTVALPVEDAPARTQTRTIALTDSTETPVAGDPKPAAQTPAVSSPVAEHPTAATTPGTDSAATATRSAAATDKPPAAASAPATAPPAAAPATAEPAAADGGWYVQLGSFGEIGNANRLASRVSTFGYTADVSAYRSGARTLNRVRVGPAPTREEAEAIASSLSAHGFVAQVVSAD